MWLDNSVDIALSIFLTLESQVQILSYSWKNFTVYSLQFTVTVKKTLLTQSSKLSAFRLKLLQ